MAISELGHLDLLGRGVVYGCGAGVSNGDGVEIPGGQSPKATGGCTSLSIIPFSATHRNVLRSSSAMALLPSNKTLSSPRFAPSSAKLVLIVLTGEFCLVGF